MQTTVVPDFSRVLTVDASEVKPKQMLHIESVEDQTIVHINTSSLSLILTCMRKSFYSLHEKWRPKSLSPPLVFGSAIHKALEVFYSYSGSERQLPRNFEEYCELLAEGNPTPESHFLYDAICAFVKEAAPLRMLPASDSRSIASGVWTLTHYFKTYLHDNYVIHRDAQGPITERFFSIPFHKEPGLTVQLFGTIDFALRNEVTGEILIGDHKTSSRMGSEFFNRIKPNHQYTAYVLGAQQALGIPSEHFLVNGIQVKAKPVTARGGPPTFTRQITRRTEQDIAEFRATLLGAVRNYLAALEDDVWPLGHVDSCANYGGCPYLDVCSAPNELRANILESKFMGAN